MKFNYLCSYHVCLMQYNEEDALRYWTETLRRGIAAFDQCRWDAARNYLGTAHEIAMLRSVAPSNCHFRPSHVLRPLEHLVEMALAENTCEVASQLVDRTRQAMDNADADWRCIVRKPLEQYQRRIHAVLSVNATRPIATDTIRRKPRFPLVVTRSDFQWVIPD